ncbi:telomere length regulation protein-domain-containing protein [Collybia nuda]|uniref:Telomere length regulation protein-domain-containing protein n=1 Tax=Collybia nuda TaxID=64659 RepID=A0A9P6CMX6_9AGAR|nr:telomere length regulation protein-domain-containing protein [Collybia nuda]
MSSEYLDNTLVQIRDVIDRLQRPVHDLQTVLALLSSPLGCLGLLPPQFRSLNIEPLADGSVVNDKHIPILQRTLLQHIAPTWGTVLGENHATLLLEQYFCPDSFSFASRAAGDVVLIAYSTILSQPLTEFAIKMLERLAKEYPLDRLYTAVFDTRRGPESKRMVQWEDCVRDITAVPGKVANALAGEGVPSLLEHGVYFNNLCVRCEQLIHSLSTQQDRNAIPGLAYLFAKLVNLGVFPATPPVLRSQPSFFQNNLDTIRVRLDTDGSNKYSEIWASLFQSLPSSSALQSILRSLLTSLQSLEHVSGNGDLERARVKQEARLLSGLAGSIVPEKEELWELASAIILERDWDIGHARIFVCWMSGVLGAFLNNVLEMWASRDHIKHSLLSRHQYVTSLLLITVSYFPPSSSNVQALAFSPAFVSAIGVYVGHLDPSVRRCGMLAAEVVAHLSGKKLNFDDWDGEDSGKPWAREIRELIKQRDVEADLSLLSTPRVDPEPAVEADETTVQRDLESNDSGTTRVTFKPATGYDSDDSIVGYASPPSSRSASPTPSELESIEKDPSLNVGVKKVVRPVYLIQLGEMLRSSGGAKASDEPHDADKIEMALNYAEELIRKKRGYGTELDENAVNLIYGLLGLQDNYDLIGFEVKRQSAMNALIAGSPRKAAPALIEEFFKNQYSTSQRYVALNALALGAREMASLPLPPPTVPVERVAFPSKTLPAPLHQKYISAADRHSIPLILGTISHQAIERGKDATADKVPELVRERRLRVPKARGVVELSQLSSVLPETRIMATALTPFTEVATEFFIGPLVNRFWLFLRDEQTREERTSHREGRERYHGAGTGLILNPIVLAHFLRTLAILVHASQNAPEWQAVVAPDALELAVTLGTKPMSRVESGDEIADDEDGESSKGKEASVLVAALELTLIVLDGCLELDGGRIIGLEHTVLLLGAGEWASRVFAGLEKGLRVEGGGGENEMKLRRAAAGVLLKVDELTSKWQRSMLDTR